MKKYRVEYTESVGIEPKVEPWHEEWEGAPTKISLAWHVDILNASYLPGGPNEAKAQRGTRPQVFLAKIVRNSDGRTMATYSPKFVWLYRNRP